MKIAGIFESLKHVGVRKLKDKAAEDLRMKAVMCI